MLNHISLLGRLTADPEISTVGEGISRGTFTLAVNRDFKDKATGNYEADFIDIIAWRQTAEFVGKYFTKGQLVCVEGRLQIDSYTDKDGVRRRAARVNAERVHFAEKKQGNEGNYANNFTPPPTQAAAPIAPVYQAPTSPTSLSTPPYTPTPVAAPVPQPPVPPVAPPAPSNAEQFSAVQAADQDDLPF